MRISKEEWEDLRMKVRELECEVDNLYRDKVKDRLKELSEKYKIKVYYFVAFYKIELIDDSNSKVIKELLREWDSSNMYKRLYEELTLAETEKAIKAYKYDLMEKEKKQESTGSATIISGTIEKANEKKERKK